MGIMTAVNLMSARSYGEFEFWFASIKVAAILVFIALAALFAFGLTSPTGPTFANLTAHGGFMPKGLVAVLAGAVTVYFSLTGAEITTIAAAESQEPARAVARMSSTVIVRILTFYVGSILLIVTVVPWTRVVSGESPFTLALTTMQFRWASLAMSAIILTAVLSCLNSAFYVCSRVLFVLAEHRDAPQWLVQVNARHVPTRSVWMGSARRRAGDTRGHHLLEDGVCLPGECLGRAHGIHIYDHRRGAPARAARARGERRARAGAHHVAVPVAELRGARRHGGGPDRHGDLPRGTRSSRSSGASFRWWSPSFCSWWSTCGARPRGSGGGLGDAAIGFMSAALTRRHFVLASAAAGGALVLGITAQRVRRAGHPRERSGSQRVRPHRLRLAS